MEMNFRFITMMLLLLLSSIWRTISVERVDDNVCIDNQQYNKQDDLRKIAIDKAKSIGIPVNIALNLIKVESNWNPHAVSEKQAYGLCQVTQIAAKEINASGDWRFDPAANIDAGFRYLQWCYRKTGTWRLALMSYNWGIGNVRKYVRGEKDVPPCVKKYVDKILGSEQEARQ